MTDQTILEKIKALRAKASNSASTESEAREAAMMAAKLMAKYDVEEDRLVEADETGAIHTTYRIKDPDVDVFVNNLWFDVATFTETQIYWHDRDLGVLAFIGVDSDVEMALYLFEMVANAAKKSWLARTIEMQGQYTVREKKTKRSGYIAGFAAGVSEAISDAIRQRREARAARQAEKPTGTDIVVVKDALIKAKRQEMGLTIRKSRRKARSVDAGAFNAGKIQGRAVNLSRPLGS